MTKLVRGVRHRGRASRSALFGAVLLTVFAVLFGGAQSTAQAVNANDAVLDWNLYAVQALINAGTAAPPGVGQPPPVSVLHLAIVQAAVYDAVNMIDGSRKPYLDGLPAAPASASKSAAVATAAHDVLVGLKGAGGASLLPGPIVTRLGIHLGDSLAAARAAEIAAGVPQLVADANVAAGTVAGAAVADEMLLPEQRGNDGRYTPGIEFTVGQGVGEWRPTPVANTNDPNAWVRVVKPFAMTSTSQFRTEGPAKIGTGRYRMEYEEVKSLGGNGLPGGTPSARTAEQTEVAAFFSTNPGGALQPDVPRPLDEQGSDPRRAGPALRHAESRRRGRRDRLLGRQGVPRVLAADHGHPAR